jgi:hypothetical protein
MPTRAGGANAAAINAREKRWDQDMPAYKRLRDQGYQPPHIDGAAHLEAGATTNHEITLGKVASNPRELEVAADLYQESQGHKFDELQTTPKQSVSP